MKINTYFIEKNDYTTSKQVIFVMGIADVSDIC